MHKPAILLTGRAAGVWYKNTLQQLEPTYNFNFVQVDFEPINALLPDKLKAAALLLEPYFQELEKQKVPYILANITLHEAVQYFTCPPKYFISIGDILQQELKEHAEKVIILGTKYTMNHSFIPSLIPNQIKEKLPIDLENEINELRKIYNNEGDIKKSTVLFQKLGKEYPKHNFMIACTELAMAFRDANPSPQLHIAHLPLLQCGYLCKKKNLL